MMLCCIIRWDVKSSKRGILRNTPPVIGISVMILQIGTFFRVEHFSRARILVLYLRNGAYLPEIMSDRLK